MIIKGYKDEIDIVAKEVAIQTKVSEEVIKKRLDSLNSLLDRELPFEDIIKISSKEIEYAVEEFKDKYRLIPGFATSARIRPSIDDNYIEVNINSGKMGYVGYNNEEDITYDSMFDLSSCSKISPVALTYQLMKAGLFKPSDKVKDLAPELTHLPDTLTVSEVIRFALTLKTPKEIPRIDEASSIDEAIEYFNQIYVEKNSRNKYYYDDLPILILQRIIENVTSMPYDEVVKEGIIKHLNLHRTALGGQVPEELMHLLTGSQNIYKQTSEGLIGRGLPNDPKACAMGGFCASAGEFANTSDAMKVFECVIDGKLFIYRLKDFYTPNTHKPIRAVAGQAIIPYSYYGYDPANADIAPIKSTGGQGSTRTSVTAGIYNINGIKYVISDAAFTNAGSANAFDILKAGEEVERKNNEKRRREGKKETIYNPDTYYMYYPNTDIYRVDVRPIADAYCLDNIAHALSNFKLRIAAAYAIRKKTESIDGEVIDKPFVMSKHL